MIDESPFSLSGNTVLITGASSGIGRAVAVLAAKMGAICIVNGRDKDRLQKTLEMLHGDGHVAIAMDIANDDRGKLIKETVEKCGPIDGFVHCAGIERTLPFRATDSTDVHDIMSINFEAYWDLTHELVKNMNRRPEHLSVVAVSSVTARYGATGETAYSASKGALISLTKSLAAEYSRKRLRFNCVMPGYIDTPMLASIKGLYKNDADFNAAITGKHPLGIGKPEDVANAVIFLLSDASKWITGTVLTVDGGYGVR